MKRLVANNPHCNLWMCSGDILTVEFTETIETNGGHLIVDKKVLESIKITENVYVTDVQVYYFENEFGLKKGYFAVLGEK